jgi:VIT1/CCC1 family predicted Fe2+/Mn2+ transporter
MSSTDENEKTALVADGARKAYDGGDMEASKNFHDTRHDVEPSSKEMHQTEGGFLKPLIFGGLDGILTAFAIVAGAAGGSMPIPVILVLGFSNILADALAMGVGEFLSSKAENEWILSERKRENWEMENYPQGEIREMIDIYEDRGMSREDATKVIETMAKYKDFFVDVMMAEELALQVPEEDHKVESMKEGVVMFCAFASFGSLPLLGYVVIPALFPSSGEDVLFTAACIITGLVLFGMGCVKSNFSAANWFISGMETLLLGGACATVAYTIGQFVDGLVDQS